MTSFKSDKDNDFGVSDSHDKVGRQVVKRQLPAWFNPLNVLTAVSLAILMFAVFGTIADQQNTRLNLDLVRIAIDQNNKQIQLSEDIKHQNRIDIEQNQVLQNQSHDIQLILQQQGNLTTEQREKLIVALERNVDLIPKVEKQTAEMLNATNLMYNFTRFISESFDEEYLIDEVRQYNQSNFTESQLPVIQVKLGQIIELLNGTGTLVPINNTDREITPG